MSTPILMIGAFDTKCAEYEFLRRQLIKLGAGVVAVNVGVLGSTDRFPVDIEAEEVASAAGESIQVLRQSNDRGAAIKVMSKGAGLLARRLYDEGRFDGIIGMGGSGGSSVITAAMRALPIGIPKVCVSTVASSDTSSYVGTKDITMIPSITDVAGVNKISRIIFTQAAGAIWGMVNAHGQATGVVDRPIIVASMFGNTTSCVDACRASLTDAGYEVLVFHATGTGGRTMESLIDEGLVDGCLDITTTEWADEICGGVFSAGQDRLSAAGRNNVPHLIVPGCVDMVNFGPIDSVPTKYRNAERLLYEWNPSVTLMRTNVEENHKMGTIFAEKANASTGPVAFLFPKAGVSILDSDGERFCNREADQALFDAVREGVNDNIPILECDANINDPLFAELAVKTMLELIRGPRP